MKYFKIFNDDDNHGGFQYKDGLNTDTMPFNDNTNAWDDGAYGFYFADANHIMNYLIFGYFIREVTIPEGASVVMCINNARANSLYLNPRRDLREGSTWEWLIENGVDVTAYHNIALLGNSEEGFLDVVKVLVKHGADVTERDNASLRLATEFGHLEVVKFLVENGADVTADASVALYRACDNGHLEVVKYLVEHGAGVMDDGNRNVRVASENGHLDVVEYLITNGAKLD